jgi:hypothetical protein
MNFLMLSYMLLPHCAALNTEVKLSFKITISAASFATSQPEMPMQNPTFACFKAETSLIPSAVTATEEPNSLRPTISVNLSSGVDLARTLRRVTIYLKLVLFDTSHFSLPSLS